MSEGKAILEHIFGAERRLRENAQKYVEDAFAEFQYHRRVESGECPECGSSAVCRITCGAQTYPYNRTGG